MELIIAIVIAVIILVWRDQAKKKRQELERRKYEIAQIAFKAQDLFEKISTLKTSTAKANNCGKALNLLAQAEEYPECRQVIQNYDELMERLEAIQKVLPVVDFVEKSYKHKFKAKDKSELNSLQDALFEIKKKGITNQDFEVALVFPEGTGEIITIEGIESRCKQLGWETSQCI